MNDQDFLNAGGRAELVNMFGTDATTRIVGDMLRPNQVTKNDERMDDHDTH